MLSATYPPSLVHAFKDSLGLPEGVCIFFYIDDTHFSVGVFLLVRVPSGMTTVRWKGDVSNVRDKLVVAQFSCCARITKCQVYVYG